MSLLGMKVGLDPGDFVLDGDPAPPPQKGGFSADVYCGQTAGWMRVVIGMEVGLNPGNFVLDGDPVLQRGQSPPPQFRPMFIAAKRLDG